ncbi:MAG: hypothetical protein LBU18_01325 [Treponema sp.]|jgi:hypothetical protein|nr:hypothetical protein [Treponema sp.]
MESKLFISKIRTKIENTVSALLNCNQLMNYNTVNSPRAVGDAIQGFLEKNIVKCLPSELVKNINTSFARRSMADLAFEDIARNYYVVDIKTHNRNTNFNMPNLTSIERLARFYGDNKNYFVLLLVSYKTVEDRLTFDNCVFVPIEYLDWSCLTLGALGWGQIQIANSNIIKINMENTQKKWMLQLCDTLDLFYPNEIAKITQRIDYFRGIREYWENQPD